MVPVLVHMKDPVKIGTDEYLYYGYVVRIYRSLDGETCEIVGPPSARPRLTTNFYLARYLINVERDDLWKEVHNIEG